MALTQNTPQLRRGRGLLEITSATIDELAELHLATCAKFAERNVDSVAGVLKAKDFGDFVERQRRQYQALWSDRERYMGSASKIIRRAIEQANELWTNPPTPPSLNEASPEPGPDASTATTRPKSSEVAPPRKVVTAGPAFELFEDQTGGHRFRLISRDGTELLTSESYKSPKGARNGIEAVRKNAGNDARYERIETDSGLPMFNLKGGNHQIIGTSLPYQSTSEMETALIMIKTASAVAQIANG
jgi:uncharacterized protein YegP (UPF0339 family)